ncbi:protein Wnt-8b-like [Periplaneta americana]|uniref:protein Wnt-8b-like n=1 Tax=Periplaneta americana TaxID=6978 RepID=UPI0037E71C97
MFLFLAVLYLGLCIRLTLGDIWSSNSNRILPQHEITKQGIMKIVASGMQLALDHCQEQFKWDQWNCPRSSFSIRGLQPTNREVAFVRAIIAAGIVYSVTKSCSRGELDCDCVRNQRGYIAEPDGDLFVWDSCNDNVDIGISVAASVMDPENNITDLHEYINLHNNAVGREAVRDCLETRCKCHGLSGSCATKVCWKEMSSFSKIATNLRTWYDRAIRMDYGDGIWSNAAERVKLKMDTVSMRQLVFSRSSPDYCRERRSLGWPGTKGRMCSRTKEINTSLRERRSCKTLCRACGYRVAKKVLTSTYQCNCTFHWCCHVNCEICKSNRVQYHCA